MVVPASHISSDFIAAEGGGCHLLEWGGPPKPPTPAQGVNFASSNGGNPQTPHSCTRGECRIFEWGGTPQTHLLPRQGRMSPIRMGGTPQTPHSRARGGCRLFEWGGPPKPPHSIARGNFATFLPIPATPKHFSCHSRYAKNINFSFPLRQLD